VEILNGRLEARQLLAAKGSPIATIEQKNCVSLTKIPRKPQSLFRNEAQFHLREKIIRVQKCRIQSGDGVLLYPFFVTVYGSQVQRFRVAFFATG
jgi:hypothetical protein